MKTIPLPRFPRIFVAATLGLLTPAVTVHAGPPPAKALQLNVSALEDQDHHHARLPNIMAGRSDWKGFDSRGMTLLPDNPGAADLSVYDINNQGQIIGAYFDADYNAYGFLFEDGEYADIDFIPWRINDRGQIVGDVYDYVTFETHEILYDKGTYTPIEFPGEMVDWTLVTGLNDRGQILGIYAEGRYIHGFIYEKGVYNALPDFPGARHTLPQGINNRGQIVGWTYDNHIVLHSFSYENGVYTVIDSPGATYTFIYDINERGQILGAAIDAAYNTTTFVLEKGVYTNINIPGVQTVYAYGINDCGQVAGSYYDEDGLSHGFVWCY